MRFDEVEGDRIDIRPEIQGDRTVLNTFYSVCGILLASKQQVTSQKT